MASLQVRYFDGRSARAHEATLDFIDGAWVVAGRFGRRSGRPEEVELGEPMGGAPRRLSWQDGACCEISDGDGLARLLALAGHAESPVLRMQRRWRWALSSIVGVIAALAAVYLYALPWAAARIAPAIPSAVTTAISEQVLQTLDQHVLAPSKLTEAKRHAIAARLGGVTRGASSIPQHRLHFRSAEALGANAFALPSGDIVVFDQLVALADNEDQVAAVIAHELGHVANRHGMRQLLQSAVVSFVVGLYFGDVSTIAASLGALVLESRYSREFEFEADRYGAELLKAGGLSPELLATMLDRLEKSHGTRHAKGAGQASEKAAEHGKKELPADETRLFETHPDTRARIGALRQIR